MMRDTSRFAPSFSYGSGGYGESSGDGLAGMVILAGLLTIVLLLLVFWGVFKAVDLVIRAWRQCNGRSLALRRALWSWLGLFGLLLLSGLGAGSGILPKDAGVVGAALAGSLLVIATIALLITARVTELKYRQMFVGEPETLVTKVLKRPWWTTSSQQVA
jgi:hypothetical protein